MLEWIPEGVWFAGGVLIVIYLLLLFVSLFVPGYTPPPGYKYPPGYKLPGYTPPLESLADVDREKLESRRLLAPGAHQGIMQFIIKVLVVGAVLVALYYTFSPYQNCMRNFPGNRTATHSRCIQETSW